MRSASSTTGSYLLDLLCLRTNTVDEELSHEGAEIPKAERLWKQRKCYSYLTKSILHYLAAEQCLSKKPLTRDHF